MDTQNQKLIGGGVKSLDLFSEIISLKNLLSAWDYFKQGKAKKLDVILFEKEHARAISALHEELKKKIYHHAPYESFYVKDPKLRAINKATVRDRVLHHAIFVKLYLIFDKSFIFDSYSSRDEKGTHRAVNRLSAFANKAGKNNTRNCFVLKCDIKKFFDSIDQDILMDLIKKRIGDKNVLWLLQEIISSFAKGLPLGNVTSQIFANIYLNELDQFIKRTLKIKYYIRYCDDLVILSENVAYLKELIPKIDTFLRDNLKLSLHPNKIEIRKYHQGIDFLGYVSFPHHKMLRVKTGHRMFRKLNAKIADFKEEKISASSFHQTLQSYYGMLKHCDSCSLGEKVIEALGEHFF